MTRGAAGIGCEARHRHRAVWPFLVLLLLMTAPSLHAVAWPDRGAFHGSMCAAAQGRSGIIRAYEGALSLPYAGANGAHRMKGALAVVEIVLLSGPNQDNRDPSIAVADASLLNGIYHNETDANQVVRNPLPQSVPTIDLADPMAQIVANAYSEIDIPVLLSATAVETGDVISVIIPESWTMPQMGNPVEAGYVSIWATVGSINDAQVVSHTISFSPMSTESGLSATIAYGSRAGGGQGFTSTLTGEFTVPIMKIPPSGAPVQIDSIFTTVLSAAPSVDDRPTPVVNVPINGFIPAGTRSIPDFRTEAPRLGNNAFKIRVTYPLPLGAAAGTMDVISTTGKNLQSESVSWNQSGDTLTSANSYVIYKGKLESGVAAHFSSKGITLVDPPPTDEPAKIDVNWRNLKSAQPKLVNTTLFYRNNNEGVDHELVITDFSYNEKTKTKRSPRFQFLVDVDYVVRVANGPSNKDRQHAETVKVSIGVKDGVNVDRTMDVILTETGADTSVFEGKLGTGGTFLPLQYESLISITLSSAPESKFEVMLDCPNIGAEWGSQYPITDLPEPYHVIKTSPNFCHEIVYRANTEGYSTAFDNGDAQADLMHWKFNATKPEPIANADILVYCGHGAGYSLNFAANPDKSRSINGSLLPQLTIKGEEMRFGAYNTDYVFMNTCNFLTFGQTRHGVSNASDAELAKLLGDGAHLLCGFESYMTIKSRAPAVAFWNYCISGRTIEAAWHAAEEDTKKSNSWSALMTYSASSIFGLNDHMNDHLPTRSHLGRVDSPDYSAPTESNPFVRKVVRHVR